MKPKIAIYYPFLRNGVKGGAEKLFFDLKEHLGADFWVGGIDLDSWGKQKASTDSFVDRLWNTPGTVNYIHTESNLPVYRLLKRQFYSLFSSKIKALNNYDIVIFSFGNLFFIPQRVSDKVLKIGYCHSTPRVLTDQLPKIKNKFPKICRPVISLLANLILYLWTLGFKKMDFKISNSKNIKKRILDYTKIPVEQVIFPPIDTDKYKFLGQKDYYLSYARLEDAKRLPLIVEAFKQMPDKKLIIASGGPLTNWIKQQIAEHGLTNITLAGFVTDEELYNLVGNCIAGIYIPEDEDAGITQCEIMSAGKPVIGVKEGGLLETIIDGKTGIMLPANPTAKDLIEAVNYLTPAKALEFREAATKQAKLFDKQIFLDRMDEVIGEALE